MRHDRNWLIDEMGRGAEADGFTRIAGRLFAELLLSDQPKSLDELADSLGVSKASVSTDARRLLDRGVVERHAKPNDRRDYYRLAPDFFSQIVRHKLERWNRIGDLMQEMSHEAGGSDVMRERFDYVTEVQDFLLGRIRQALDDWQTEQRKQRKRVRAAVRTARPRTPSGEKVRRG